MNGDDVAKIAILGVQRGQPQARAERGGKGKQDEEWQRQDAPVRDEADTMPSAPQARRRRSAKSTRLTIIALRRNDQPRKVDFGNQVAVANETVAAIRERGGEKLPGNMAANTRSGYGTPSEGSFAILPKTTVSTSSVTSGLISAQAIPMRSACSEPECRARPGSRKARGNATVRADTCCRDSQPR